MYRVSLQFLRVKIDQVHRHEIFHTQFSEIPRRKFAHWARPRESRNRWSPKRNSDLWFLSIRITRRCGGKQRRWFQFRSGFVEMACISTPINHWRCIKCHLKLGHLQFTIDTRRIANHEIFSVMKSSVPFTSDVGKVPLARRTAESSGHMWANRLRFVDR